MEQKAGFSHDVDNVIILKDISRRIWARPGAVHINSSNTPVLLSGIHNQVKHVLLASHENKSLH